MTWRMMVPLSTRAFAAPVADPFAALQRHINSAFDTMVSSFPDVGPSVPLRLDVKEDEKSFQVAAELPGMTDRDVEVTYKDGLLTIRGEKKVERDEKTDTWHVVERSSGSFMRQLGLPAGIEEGAIEAIFEKGVLRVTLPKGGVEKSSTRKIEVKSA